MPIVVFNSTHQALEAESLLEERAFDIDIVPLPEGAGADCGMAIRIEAGDRAAVEALLVEARINFKQII
jgi:hypothetical protein